MISLTRCSTIRPRRLNCDNHRLYELAIYFNLGGLPKYWFTLYALAPPVSPLTYPSELIIIVCSLVKWCLKKYLINWLPHLPNVVRSSFRNWLLFKKVINSIYLTKVFFDDKIIMKNSYWLGRIENFIIWILLFCFAGNQLQFHLAIS